MYILIDFDNVHPAYRGRGTTDLVQRILDAIGLAALKATTRVQVRFYGGWFEGNSTSRRAQNLASETAAFPQVFTVDDGATQVQVVASAALATGPIHEPKLFFTHTFRVRGQVNGLQCQAHPLTGCSAPGKCAMAALPDLIANNQCPEPGCCATADSNICRAEQKLVDTLIVSDLLCLAHQQEAAAVLVSTDDDMWPGVRSALLWGMTVYHVHPVPLRSTPTHYLIAVPAGYRQSTLSI